MRLILVVFQIGVLNDEVLPRRLADARMECCSLPLVDQVGVVLNIKTGISRPVALDGPFGIIRRTIIDDDELFTDGTGQLYISYLIEDEVNRPLLVVGGDDDGELGYCWH